MQVEDWPIGKVKRYDKNPRNISHVAIDKVAKSIEAFGFRQAIVVDEQGVILAGHTRYAASKKLGLKTVPVHVAIGLAPEQARAYRLADNRVADETSFAQDVLAEEMIALYEADFNLPDTGFNPDEIAFMFGIDLEQPEEPTAAENACKFKLSLEFDTEREQQAVLAEMQGRGITCKASGGERA